jgi:hypothetical protein
VGKLLNDARHWRDRAEEARIHAEQMHDPDARGKMLGIAASYERIAERAEERLQPRVDPHGRAARPGGP